MGKRKKTEGDDRFRTTLRIPFPLWSRLLRVAAERADKEKRSISTNELIVEAVQRAYN